MPTHDEAARSRAGIAADRPAERDAVALVLLALASGVVFVQPFVPLDEFIHRGDDAYYYFQVAINYARLGFWTFDGANPTNGVQPLWAWLLTSLSVAAHGLGLSEKVLLARLFVAVTALVHVGSVALLVRLLARTVSFDVAVTAGGALVFSMGTVFVHTWGMENSLYALFLIASVAYLRLVLDRDPTPRRAVVFGVLLGLTALARLNAALFGVVAVAAFLVGHFRGLGRRAVALAATAGLCASMVVVPYFAWNYATTGHLVPVSAAAKNVQTAEYKLEPGREHPWSPRYLGDVAKKYRYQISDFLTGPLADAMWPLGGRAVFRNDRGIGPKAFALIGGCVGLLLLTRSSRGRLRDRMRALRPFAFVAVYAVLNGVISLISYPLQVGYAMTRWWLVETELLLTVMAATVVATLAGSAFGFERSAGRRGWFWRAAILAAGIFAYAQTFALYWNGKYDLRDWNASWNDHSYRAAMWLARCVPADARVGSWNAGVLGYHAAQPVTNLDGLINNHALIPHLRDGTLATYIRRQGIRYLSDADGVLKKAGDLPVHEIYRSFTPIIRQHYRILEVLPAADASPSPVTADCEATNGLPRQTAGGGSSLGPVDMLASAPVPR